MCLRSLLRPSLALIACNDPLQFACEDDRPARRTRLLDGIEISEGSSQIRAATERGHSSEEVTQVVVDLASFSTSSAKASALLIAWR